FLATFLCVSSPYLIYQYYAGFLYCFAFPKPASLSFMLPRRPSPELKELANELEVLTPYSVNSSFKPLWCAGVPWSSYMLLQKKFWDVGMFTYYQWKQLPNFLLALPVLFLVFKSVSLFGRKAPKTLLSLGIVEDHGKQLLVVPHIYHALFLSTYGIVNVHIQVLTRMLFSSCPVLYWYCASVLLNEQDNVFGRPHLRKAKTKASSKLRQLTGLFCFVNPLSHPPWSYQRALLYYFYSYIVIGCLMHSNFLPWT
ncbi:GPI mannosyltransferase 2, partial [Taenia solium]